MNAFKNANIITGKDQLNNKVTGVTILEAPDIGDWLNGGEIILTSLYPIESNDESYKKLIVNLNQKNISAIVIKIHRFIEEIPEIIIENAKKYNIPIIELPKDVKYLDIIYPVMTRITNHKVAKLSYFKKIHKNFTALALKGEGLKSIIKELKIQIDKEVILYDKNLKTITNTNKSLENIDPPDPEIFQSNIIYNNFYYQKIDNEDFNKQIIVPIKIEKSIKAYLTVLENNNKLKDLHYIALENAATVISLEMTKKLAVKRVIQQFENDLVNDIIMGKFNSKEYIIERAKLINWNLERKFRIVIFKIFNLEELTVKFENYDNFFIKNKIQSSITSIINNYVSNPIIGNKSNSIIVFWPESDNELNSKEKIRKTAKKIKNKLNKQFKDIKISIASSNIANNLEEIHKKYQEALETIDLGKIVFDDNKILNYSDLGIFRLLCKFEKKENLKSFVPKSINKLLEYDDKNNSNLIETLNTFFKCNANAKKAASELFIHYRTMLYRLDRIKKIGNINLDNYEQRLEIQVGLKILNLIDNDKF